MIRCFVTTTCSVQVSMIANSLSFLLLHYTTLFTLVHTNKMLGLTWLTGALVALSVSIGPTSAAKYHDFKECHQQSFCRRLRGIAGRAEQDAGFTSPYSLGKSTGHQDEASWSFPLDTRLYNDVSFELQLDILDVDHGIPRIRVDEVGSALPLKRYNEAAKWALVEAEPSKKSLSNVQFTTTEATTTVEYGSLDNGDKLVVVLQHDPLLITFKQGNEDVMIINDRNLFHMEHFRTQTTENAGDDQQKVLKTPAPDTTWFEGEPDKDAFAESWKQWKDSKPKGPEGFSVDVTFPSSQHLYGLAEHASPLVLRATDGSSDKAFKEPYRLYNVDIFEYDADSPMSMYGNIPLIHAQTATRSVGILNLVASETLVDVKYRTRGASTHWFSESGIVDLFILPGPKPEDLYKQYAELTGYTPLPPLWSIAYHQCRWNYYDQVDVMQVNERFNEEDISLDVTWLDIEYADEHKYTVWNKKQFPNPVEMQNAVAEMGRKMVVVVDPHVKKQDGFDIYQQALEKNLSVKKADKSTPHEGWCWTGSSIWIDFFSQAARKWWADLFKLDAWTDSTSSLFIWNDMNEPSVFDGPEISLPRDTVHEGGWENRDVHNVYSIQVHRATFDGLLNRQPTGQALKRPFVLSRAFYAGSQRYGAIWTGDNLGSWDHLSGQTSMLLSLNICGMTFSGADVGGFFGNPDEEMLIRWYQAGTFGPFFRAHAHIDTKRREPYLYDEPTKGMLRDAIQLRYQLLSVWYTAFYESSLSGAPIIK